MNFNLMKKGISTLLFMLIINMTALAQTQPVVYRVMAKSFTHLPQYVEVPKGYVLTPLSKGWAIVSKKGTYDWSKAQRMQEWVKIMGWKEATIYKSKQKVSSLISK